MDNPFGDSTTQPPPSSLTESKYGLLNIFVLGFFFGIVIYFIAWELLDRLFLLGSKLGWVKKDAVTTAFNCFWSEGNPELQPTKKRTYQQKNILLDNNPRALWQWFGEASHRQIVQASLLLETTALLKDSKVDQLPNLPWSPKSGDIEDLPVYHALEQGPPPSHLCLKIRHIVFHLVCCIFALATTIAFMYGCIFIDVNCRGMMTALTLPDYSCMSD